MVLFCWMITMATMFAFGIVVIVCYWISAIRLARHTKTEEPRLWAEIGAPDNFFAIYFNITDLILATKNQRRFLRWFYTGAEGAEHPKTKVMARTTRQLCRVAMMVFIGLIIGIFIGIVLLVLLTK